MSSNAARAPALIVRHRRLLVAVVAALVVIAPIGYLWASSLLPDTYSVMDMGYPDYGGGPRPGDQDAPMAGMVDMPGMLSQEILMVTPSFGSACACLNSAALALK